MKIHNKFQKLPDGFTQNDIKIESSTCTGEKTIGFYSKSEKRLKYAELVRSEEDIILFCRKYGIDRNVLR